MSRSESVRDVRGARDLVDLWRALPVAVLRYPVAALPPGVGLAALSGTLRSRAWRDHCVSPTLASCAGLDRNCALCDSGRCRADMLFPMRIGGGTPSWRMATLSLQWRPSLEELRLIALGETACGALGWAARCLYDQHGLDGCEPLDVSVLADLELRRSARWRLVFVTPWLVCKNPRAMIADPAAVAVAHEIRKAMRVRAYKLTALCAHGGTSQRLGAHLAEHVADRLLAGGIAVEEARVQATPLQLQSRGSESEFEALTWSGETILRVEPNALPWLSLVALCGGGENPDKGFGGVELTPLD